jgi:uncharacterized protein YjiS (DUF1127 family)
MAMTDVSSDQWLALAPLAGWPEARRRRGLLSQLWVGFRSRLAQRQTVRILNGLDGATLKDLGINPRDVESVVYGDSEDRLRGYDKDWWRR